MIDESRLSVEEFLRVPTVVDVNSFQTIQFNRKADFMSELPDGKNFLFNYDGRDDSKFTTSSPHFFGLVQSDSNAEEVCVDGLSPNEKRHLSRHNLESNTGILIGKISYLNFIQSYNKNWPMNRKFFSFFFKEKYILPAH